MTFRNRSKHIPDYTASEGRYFRIPAASNYIARNGRLIDMDSFLQSHFICNLYQYIQQIALTSPTIGGRSVGIVRSRTQATELVS
jgi:hypothetical protein